jgi:type II secretory pathway pseudopilin PulG
MNNKWFSFVELIIAISLVVLLAFIGLNTNNSYQEKTNNSKITADLNTLSNSLLSYSQEKSDLPLPGWNNNFFDNEWQYSHSFDSESTFWVSWFITENTLQKKYLNYLPIDPKTNQYYAYAKTKAMLSFQIAWVVWENSEPKSNVIWNYSWENGIFDLIREYNWPNFIYDKSKESFPYTPDTREMTARIYDFTWSVSINGNTWLSASWILDFILREWDQISTTQKSYATIYFSDWSKSVLWDENIASSLSLSNMKYDWDNNLVTKIKLALWWGTIWNNATKLNTDWSEFEIYTTDSTAAVRWTVFWVRKEYNTNITVEKWEVELLKRSDSFSSPMNLDDLVSKVKKWLIYYTPYTWDSKIKVSEWETPIWWNTILGSVMLYTWTTIGFTNAKDSTSSWEIDKLIISDNQETKLDTLSGSAPNKNLHISLKLNNSFKKADYLKLKTWNDTCILKNNNWSNKSILPLIYDETPWLSNTNVLCLWTWWWWYNNNQSLWVVIWNNPENTNKQITFSFCKTRKNWQEKCSRERIVNLDSWNYNNTIVWDTNKEVVCAPGTNKLAYTDDNNGCIRNNLFDRKITDPKKQWQLIWYAPFDKENDFSIYKVFDSVSGWKINRIALLLNNNHSYFSLASLLGIESAEASTTDSPLDTTGGTTNWVTSTPTATTAIPGIIFKDGGIVIGTGASVRYSDLWKNLGIWLNNFSYQFEISGYDLLTKEKVIASNWGVFIYLYKWNIYLKRYIPSQYMKNWLRSIILINTNTYDKNIISIHKNYTITYKTEFINGKWYYKLELNDGPYTIASGSILSSLSCLNSGGIKIVVWLDTITCITWQNIRWEDNADYKIMSQTLLSNRWYDINNLELLKLPTDNVFMIWNLIKVPVDSTNYNFSWKINSFKIYKKSL